MTSIFIDDKITDNFVIYEDYNKVFDEQIALMFKLKSSKGTSKWENVMKVCLNKSSLLVVCTYIRWCTMN